MQISLSAARAKTGDGNEVRLLWTVTQGWLPAAGVDVYRSDKPTQKLNASPIKFDPNGLTPEAAARVSRTIAPGRKLFGAGIHAGTSGAPLSSLGAFQAFKGQVTALQRTAGVRPGQLAAEAAKAPQVLAYRKNLLIVPPPAAKAAQPAPTADDATASTRVQILIASLANYTAALHYGFAYTDKTMPPATACTYTLKAADTGATLATADVRAISLTPRIGSESALDVFQPPAPVPDAAQLGQGRVALHWEPVAPIVEQALVSLNYNVYRGGKKLNKSPIHLAYLPTTDQGHVATMASFIDDDAPQSGTAAYTVTLTDAFGRVSGPGAASATMVDLRVPGPTGGMIAVLSKRTGGAIRLFWIACDPATGDMPVTNPPAVIDYCLYRTAAGQAETTLSSPVADTPPPGLSATGLPPGDFDDLTVGTFLGLDPTFRDRLLAAGLTEKERLTRRNAIKKILNEPLAALTGQIPFGLKPTFAAELGRFRTYLDATTTSDIDYVYRVAPRYVLNDQHDGTGARTATLAVPTAAAPGAVAQFGGAFTKGAGTFGYVNEGATPTMRLAPSSGAAFEQGHFKAPTAQAAIDAAPTTPQTTGARKTSAPQKKGTSFAGLTPITSVNSFLTAHPQYKIADNEKAPPMAIAGTVKLTWQASAFTSPARYRVYRAAATGLFPNVQTAERAGAPPMMPTLNTVAKIGGAQKSSFADVAKARTTITMQYFADNPNVPNQNYALLAETAKLQFVDTIPASQRMHYVYRVVPVSRWNVEGPQTPVADVAIPAALPPSIPTLLKTQVDDGVAEGHVRLTIGINPANENVAKYYVFRKLFTDSANQATAQVRREAATVRVASRRGAFAAAAPPPAAKLNPGVPTGHRQNVGTLKANNSALLKSILDPTTYKLAGTIPAPATLPAGATTLHFTDTTGVPLVPYTYMIVAINGDQISSKPSAPLDATALKLYCASPLNLKSVIDTSGDSAKVTVSWQPPTTETPTNYILERASSHLASAPTSKIGQLQQIKAGVDSNAPAPTYVTMANTTSLTFPDSSVRSGRHYTYRLRAVDAQGLVSLPLTTTTDVPALAAANFGDPAPPAAQPVDPTKAPTPNTPPTTGTTGRPATPVATTGTPKIGTTGGIGTPGAGGGTLVTPKPATGAAHFHDAYFLTGDDVFAVQVEKASYAIQGYSIDAQNFYYCRPTEKFLKLTLLVKNVTAQPQPFDYQTVTAGGMTADGDDLAPTKNWKALDTGKLANRTVAPGATFEIEGVVMVPADGTPKSLTFGGLAFDLTAVANAIDPLPDTLGGGDRAPAEAAARADGTFYSLAFTDGAVHTTTLPNGLGVDLTVRNATQKMLSVANENYAVELLDEDGDKYPLNKSTAAAPVSLASGATATLHFAFDVPKTIKLKSLKVRERDGRIYVFPAGTN